MDQGAMSDLIVQLDSSSFRAALKRKVVLVEFWEPWCGPCQIQQHVLEEVAHRLAGHAIVAKVNVDEAQKLAASFGIQSLPVLVLFKNGKVVRRFFGRHSAAALTAAIEDTARRQPINHQPSIAHPPTAQPTLHAHLLQTRRGRAKPLDVLVVHDGIRAQRWVKELLLRLGDHVGAGLRLACAYQRIGGPLPHQGIRKSQPIDLVFVAASCWAKLSPENLKGITSLLPGLRANHGAVAFLSGTSVPRHLEVTLVERFLRTHSERAGVAFFSGGMPGLGCPGCGTAKREKPGSLVASHVCVLHAPQELLALTLPAGARKSKPAKMKTPPAPPANSGKPAHAASKRQLRHDPLRQRAF
jgi:thioredoxin 1